MWELWPHVEADVHQLFGLDLDDIPDRSWRWLRVRLEAVLTDATTRTYRMTHRR